MMRLLRLARIVTVALRFGLDEFLLAHARLGGLRVLVAATLFWRRLDRPRGERLRLALENLGPIFVKFGQVLSTRRDLLPLDIADELAKLQDRVPPFASELAVAEIERSLGKRIDELCASLVERLWPEGRRLKPREVVAEFAHHLDEELDLMREAANASQLRRNFE